MKIRNETRYESAGLREIVFRVAAVELDTAKRKRLVVDIKETIRGISRSDELGVSCLGHAWIGGFSCTLYVPRNFERFEAEMFAHAVAHEFAHLRGMTHRKMRGNPRYSWVPSKRWEDGERDGKKRKVSVAQTGWVEAVRERGYVDGVEVRLRPKKTRPKPSDEEKRANVLKLMASWETKKKRAEAALKKYRRKARYYERKIAAKDSR